MLSHREWRNQGFPYLPILFRGHRYLDGGVTEAIPLASTRALGATHAMVLQTRHRDCGTHRPKACSRDWWKAAYARSYTNRELVKPVLKPFLR